ncbi:MAG: hypothetical protein HDR56_04675 [Treponema sp.]|nr:hypothetical protein [Treponema sp.]
MNKTIFQKISVVTAAAIIIASLFSCHPDGPEDFIDYVYDAGNMGGGNQNINTNDWSYPTSKPQQLWSGSGYSYDPYIIKTAQDLANLAYMVNYGYSYEYTYFKLDRNIDLNYGISVNAYSSNAKEWTSIGSSSYPFKGNFDGNNYTINGLYKNSLFGYISEGSVKNLTMGTGYIYYSYNVGSIASYIYNTTISNCTNNGTSMSSEYSGGLVGTMEHSEISNSSNYADVTSPYSYAGGIAGYADYNSSCSGCHNYGTVSGYYTKSDIVGNWENTENKDENDWSYPTSRPQRLWSGSGYSYDPYIIKTAQDLANLAYMVNHGYSYEDTYFKLDRSIDLNYGISVNESSSNAKEWTSIGSSSYPFKGNFDGNGYTIDDLYGDSLFGYISNGSITNLTMGTGYIYSYSYNVSSIADYIYNTTISNCTNNGTIVSSSYGHSGGLVGKMKHSEISSSDNYANVSSTNEAAGGIVGYMSSSSTISNSHNYATVSSSSYYAGGIVGYAEDDNSYCPGCYNYGYVSGSTQGDIIGNR